ncbi:OsmC family peroxiredoxin [Actinomadura sp. KC216]|uniref:OsmC family protein n=1 Tax=Actinomadura sp. KC216 TaxID=2530370 RepID=UPI00104DAEC2|nr:OsmC family protein [Actinomadura sp. KC216]TDB86220.1 OsmC family peroxiredoxin [Actinomadura sp. KC216]
MSGTTESLPVVERSRVSVVPAPGRTKLVTVPVDGGPVPMGMHGPVAEHYQVPMDQIEPHATTLDYVVGAATGCLAGTFGGMLGALGQPVADGALLAEGEGEIVNDGGVLRIARITVRYRLRLAHGVDEAKVRRAHDRHTERCPVARSLAGGIPIHTRLDLGESAAE